MAVGDRIATWDHVQDRVDLMANSLRRENEMCQRRLDGALTRLYIAEQQIKEMQAEIVGLRGKSNLKPISGARPS